MERPRISFGDPADSDGDRPVKRPRTALLNQLGSATPPAISFGTVSFEKKPTGLDFSSTPTNRPLFGTLGLSNSTTFTSIFGAANLGTPPLPEQQPGQFNTKSGTEMPIPDTTTSHSRPETPAASNSLFTDASLALGPFPGAKTSTFVSPPAGLRMEDLLFKRDEAAIMQEAEDIVKQEPQQESGLKNTVGTVQLKTEELAVIAPTESFDDHGDLTLVVGEAQTRFLVCSHSLRRVSTTWHDRLYGVSSNPKDREGANGWVVRLPEGNPEAMRIILRVVHSDLSKMPAAVSRRLLCHLTFLCDKHDMLSILKPFWAGWVGKLANPSVQPTGLRHEVWVAHKLGHLVWYKHILLQLLSLTHKRPNGRLFLASHADADLYKEPHLLQPVFLKSLEDGRLKILRTVGSTLRTALDQLLDPNTTNCRSYKSHDWQQTCDCAMLGGVHRALNGKEWYSAGALHWEESVAISARQLVANIEGVRAAAVEESRMARKQGDAHKHCTPWTPFTLDHILQYCPVDHAVPIDTAAFQKQAEICGLSVLAAASKEPVV